MMSAVAPAAIELNELEWPSAEVGSWHVLRTRSRHEKVLAADLAAMGIAHFLPLARVQRDYAGQKVNIEVPLFPGYLFLRGTIDEAYSADRTQHVAQIIQVVDQDQLDWELRNLALTIQSGLQLDAFPHLRCGVRVEVRSGPLRGVQGLVQDRTRRDRLILQVDMLGRALSLEVDAALLDIID